MLSDTLKNILPKKESLFGGQPGSYAYTDTHDSISFLELFTLDKPFTAPGVSGTS